MKITPRWTGSIPNLEARGTIRGTTTKMALNMSIIQPTRIKKMFNTSRNPILVVTVASMRFRIFMGMNASTR